MIPPVAMARIMSPVGDCGTAELVAAGQYLRCMRSAFGMVSGPGFTAALLRRNDCGNNRPVIAACMVFGRHYPHGKCLPLQGRHHMIDLGTEERR